MSPGAQRALNTPMTEGYDDSAVWVAKGVNLIGALVPDMVAGGVTKKLGEVTLRKVLTAGLEKNTLRQGCSRKELPHWQQKLSIKNAGFIPGRPDHPFLSQRTGAECNGSSRLCS